MKQLTYFHLVFMTRGWLYKMANHYCFQTKLGEEEREAAELDCPWPMTNRQLSCHLCFGHLSSCRKYIWNETPYSAEAQSSPWIFFFPSWKEIWLKKGEGRRQEYKANSQENSKHISMDKIDLPAGKSKFGWGSSTSQSLDAGFKHAHSSFT